MTRPIVVGYTATPAGADAIAVASRLAAALGASLELVMVTPITARSGVVPPLDGYTDHVREQSREWLREATTLVPEGIASKGHVRPAESFAEGLVNAAAEFGASHIVIGAANSGTFGRHRLGSVANDLLHSSDVSVVLAPAGYAGVTTPITRFTAALGERVGADALLEEAVDLAKATGAELRLLSLVAIDMPASLDTQALHLAGTSHADEILAHTTKALPSDVKTEAIVASGSSVEDAVARLDWSDGEFVIVGSSRLAQPRRLFLGSTASKMLRVLPVPMIVVPRTRNEGN
ncbi:universal stress protein [Microbacterium sp. NC79]|uniref:universal stress protein n=1 Tax=Microbacterium sp. NC79 TaxID=2851009 RepID=UPI001C2C12AA|nr:universal stress protein [Microbacterium sp. NC79]MBV0895606.1 universal stress protein [Microbacterium sp. NC79]